MIDFQENDDESKRASAKQKRKETELPISIRLSGVNKTELDRFAEQEVSPSIIETGALVTPSF